MLHIVFFIISSSFPLSSVFRKYVISFFSFIFNIKSSMSFSLKSSFISISSNGFCSFVSSLNENLSIYLLNLNFVNISNTFSLSHSFLSKSSIFSSKGLLMFIVPSVLERRALSFPIY